MRFLHTADWHIGKIVNDFSMLPYQHDMIQQIIELLSKEHYDALIIAGDLYDRPNASSEAVKLVHESFKKILLELKTPILLISGNHDSLQSIEYGNFLFEHQQFYSEGLYKEPMKKVSFDDTDIYLFPFVTPASMAHTLENPNIKTYQDVFDEAISKLNIDKSRQNVLVAHGYLVSNGQVIEKEDSVRPLSIGTTEYVDVNVLNDFDYVALGHLHSYHPIGSEKVRYSGSLYKYSKSEAKNTLKVLDVTLLNKELSVNPIILKPNKDMVVFKGSFDEALKYQTQDFVFYELNDTHLHQEAMTRIKKVNPYAMGLTYVNIEFSSQISKTNQVEMASKSLYELYSEFFESSLDRPLTMQQQEYVHQIIQEISK